MTPLEWTKKHQKEVINKIISDTNLKPQALPVAIFMAGLPGAGKTELSCGLIEQSFPRPLRIDMDELATLIQGYTPEKADEFRGAATRLLNALFDKTIRNRLDFVLDGTFGSPKALQNIERVLKRDYLVKIAYAYQDPKLAWNFTKAREKVEHRAISKEGFLEAYFKTLNNLKKALEKWPKEVSLDIFIKNEDNTVGQQYSNVKSNQIDEIIPLIYNKEKLKQYIES